MNSSSQSPADKALETLPLTENSGFQDRLRDALFRLGRVMERVDDLDSLLHTVICECNGLLDCEASSVALYDAERNDLVFCVAAGGSERSIKQWRIRMGQGIVGQVAQNRECMFSNDPQNDARWFGGVDTSTGFVTRNLAAVPMLRGETLVGVVEVMNRRGAGFTDSDLRMLQIFADQAALALEIHRLIKAKQESERLATFAVALADIGHSAKNLLMRMEFPLKLIDRALERGDTGKAREFWPVMKNATSEIGRLVRDMLDYSRARSPELSEVEVGRLVREVTGECRPDAESKKIGLSVEGAESETPWVFDEKAVRSALHNLIGNAIEAIAEHGGSCVTVRVIVDAAHEQLQLSVADDGPGIPQEIQRRIFDPFFSTKGKAGTGLGLAGVKKTVEEHGGRVLLVSEPGKGATFTLTFPQASVSIRA